MGMGMMPPLGSMGAQFGAGAPQMDPASMAQFQQAFMAQQMNMMQLFNNNAGGDDGEGAGAPRSSSLLSPIRLPPPP